MNQIYTTGIWSKLARSINKAKSRIASIAYVSNGDLIKFKSDDVLICNAGRSAIQCGETSARAIEKYFNRGVKIFSHSSLHAKCLVYDDNVLLGSSNLSASSNEQLTELALLTDSSPIHSQVMAFLYSLQEEAIEIDRPFIDRILKIPVSMRRGRSTLPVQTTSPALGNRLWIINAKEKDWDNKHYVNEMALVSEATAKVSEEFHLKEDNVSWIRFNGSARFRKLSKRGDRVVEISRDKNDHNVTVSPPTSILKKQISKHWWRIYYKAPPEKDILKWNEFKKALKNLGITSIKKTSLKEISGRQEALITAIWQK